MGYLLGIDIGTSGTKTVLFDALGHVIASAVQEYPLYQPCPGWAEQDPDDWWNAAVSTIHEVLAQGDINASDISGIGLTGQMHGAVLLDKDGRVLRKAIIWCDQRSFAECEQITSLVGAEKLIKITGNPALTGFTASKILWVRNHEPAIFARVDKVLLPKDYVRFKLTGEYATDVSDASGMQFMNVPKRQWSQEILNLLGIELSLLGNLYESQEISGKISSSAAALTGLKQGTPVAAGAGDQASGAIGNGIVKSGLISSTIGTSGVVFALTDRVKIDPQGRVHTFCHAVPDRWHIMGVTQGAGLSLQWFRDNFCLKEKMDAETLKIDPYELMSREAEKAEPGCGGLIYLPYLMGERSPHLDPFARGVFFGITARHEKRDFIRAIMEGVVYSLNDCLEIMREMAVEITGVRASGGGGKSSLWRQIQADVFGVDINSINPREGPALGAALLAGVGSGVYRDIAEACNTAIKVTSMQPPDSALHERYMPYYKIYKQLYCSLKPSFKDLANLN